MDLTAAVPRASRQAPLPLSVPVLAGNEAAYVQECLATGWVSSVGPFVDRFERAVADCAGARHGVAVVNGTAGLHLALQVAGIEPGDEVLVSDLTFIAPVNAIRYCGAHPVFVDAEPDAWQFDWRLAECWLAERGELRDGACYDRRTGRRLRAIVPVHILGLACEIEAIVDLARRFRLRVVEDAAEAMGVRVRGRHPGTVGDVGVVSFNGNKIITAGGGGVILTNDEAIARRARYLSTQAKDDPDEYVHDAIGYNYRLTNLQAAVGLAQLEQLDAFVEKKRRIAAWYAARLPALPGVAPMPEPAEVRGTAWLYTALLPPAASLERRQLVLKTLQRAGIGARPLWHPIHGLRLYRGCEAIGGAVADDLYRRAISLPSSASLEEADVERCVEALAAALREPVGR